MVLPDLGGHRRAHAKVRHRGEYARDGATMRMRT
jgi:hypothetical protein